MREDLLPQKYETKMAHVVEEAAEVILAYAKMQRFGKTAVDPKTNIEYNNENDFVLEVRQLKYAIERYLKELL